MATETILLVDDEEIVIGVGTQMLKKMGFSVLTAKNGKEALEVYKQHRNDIDLVILDMIMPGLRAADTYDELKSIDPAIRVLLASGYGADQQTGELLNRGFNGFIQKPFNIQALIDKIRDIIDKP